MKTCENEKNAHTSMRSLILITILYINLNEIFARNLVEIRKSLKLNEIPNSHYNSLHNLIKSLLTTYENEKKL